MVKSLPQQIDPIALCNTGATLEGEIPIERMTRLAELLTEKSGRIGISLQFGKDKHGFRVICGKIRGPLTLVCQRCMQPMAYDVAVDVKLSPVFNDAEAVRLPKEFEALYVTAEPLLLTELVEVLNMPLIAKHKNGECTVEESDYLNMGESSRRDDH